MIRKAAFLLLLLVFLFTSVILSLSKDAFAFKLPDTGQTKCYQVVDPYAEIPCAGTGQDGAYDINPLSYTDNGNGTVTDNNTGLIWQQDNNETICNWYRASGTYHATYNPSSQNVCGELTIGNYSDWRLPTKMELMSIVDYSISQSGPTIKTAYFHGAGSVYWTPTTCDNPDNAWVVDFSHGAVRDDWRKIWNGYIRCVRGEQLEFGNFTDNHDGTINDTSTGLMWQQVEPGGMKWADALNYCENLELPSGSGQTGWRLPNIKELESITDDARWNPALDTTFFPDAQSGYYYSSTNRADNPVFAWQEYFGTGSVFYYFKYTYGNYPVRCVRDGPSFDYYCDDDSDTYIDSVIDGTCRGIGCKPQGCQITPGDDCNDSNPLEHPNQTWYKDADNDGYSDGTINTTSCTRPVEYKASSELTAASGDCNDGNAAINPGATEICDGIDNNCSGQIDEGVKNTYYRDFDVDGFGDPANSTQSCTVPADYVTNNLDCDDNDAKEHPGQTWYKDADGDGYSDGITNTVSCTRPTGYKVSSELTATSGDCNDGNAAIKPGVAEICDGIDNDCDSQIDEELQYDLTTSVNPIGGGSITPDCSGGCTYTCNAQVSLTAIAASGSTFTGWSGDSDCSDGTVIMNADKICTANFTKVKFEENDVAITYTGAWNTKSCPSCSGGSLKYSTQTGAKAVFSFNGTGIKWMVAKANNLGKAKVYLDGVYMGLVDLYSASPKYQVILQKTGLALGAHTVTIEVSGQKNIFSKGTYVDIDAFEVITQMSLTVIPVAQTISSPAIGNTRTYSLLGGTGPYKAFSDSPGLVAVPVNHRRYTDRDCGRCACC